MTTITFDQLVRIAGVTPNKDNVKSVVRALVDYGPAAGLDKPHRLAHFIAQVAHESGGFRFDREIWGPTPAQQRYDTRTDLGNTPAVDGDGRKNAGRGPIQLTGGYNIKRFHDWCVAEGYQPPDFVANPDLINTDPWEGLSAIFFWSVGNPTGKSLNVYADENNIEQITKKINGGLNGFADRVRYYVRTALVLLGYAPDDVRGFQMKAFPRSPDQVDGDAGPKTRAALHMALVNGTPAHVMAEVEVRSAPVTDTVAVDVKAPGRGVADAATGVGASGLGIGGVLQTLQEQLTPFSAAGGWISKLVVILIVAGAVLTIGGLAWRWWSTRKKAQTIAAINANPQVQ